MMAHIVETYVHSSKQLSLTAYRDPNYLVATYGNLSSVNAAEYLAFLATTGDTLKQLQTGRLLADFSQMENFSTELSAVAINNFKSLITDHIPFLLLAIFAGPHFFTNTSIKLSLEIAKPLSKKFIDGQIFKRKDEAVQWLLDYPVRQLSK